MRWDKDYKNPEVINDPSIIPAYGVTDEERAYWNKKQNPLEYDAEPTQYSDKHLISGAIYNALEQYKVSTVQLCQDFYWGVAEGLGETKQACEDYAAAALQSETNAAASEGAALISKNAAAHSQDEAANSEANALISKNNAAVSANNSLNSSRDAEAWATGTRNGVPVPATDPTYHNNSRYYAGLGSDVIQDDETSEFTTWSSNKLTEDFAGKADLVDGKVPAAQLPSYVDDVKEYDSVSDFPAEGESDKIYIDKTTNLQYRWSGTTYVIISESLALGETSSTAYPGNLGKATTDMLAAVQAKIPDTASAENKLAPRNELPTQLSQLSDDASHRLVTDSEKSGWDSKAAGDHNHDSRYYTESEMDTALAGKSNTGHTHDDRYYTETEIDNKFNGVTFTTEDDVLYINW